MKLFVEYTDYTYTPAVDVSTFKLNLYPKVLVVCAKEQQKKRLLKLKSNGFHNATVLGFWDLDGLDVTETLEAFDAVFVLDPERIRDPGPQTQWKRIIECFCSTH